MGSGSDSIKEEAEIKTIFFWGSILSLLVFVTGCNVIESLNVKPDPVDSYYITGSPANREALRDLFTLLRKEDWNEDERFSLTQEIANNYAQFKEYGRLVTFLTAWINEHPNDPYTAYYLFMTAYAYIQQDAYPVAALYFDLIIKNYPDMIFRGESIHFIALNQLITLIKDPVQLVWYYEELISRFSDKIDPGASYFMLGQAYEQVGEWNRAIQAYTQFLPYYGTVIPGFPDAYTYAKQLVDFNNSSKDWTFESINTLISAVKTALDTGNSVRLWQYRAKVNFFYRSWEQVEEDNAEMAEFSLSSFMRGSPIRYASELDESSNASEAYLRTWGWAHISTWYFYFRKIYFPLNPEIHGRWEWAGVYYGEKF
jgi:tetratricopeptide (TPR) repeat protein